MNARTRGRQAKIQLEAEGYLELGMPEHALQTLGRLGDPAKFDVGALYLWGEGLGAGTLLRGPHAVGAGGQGRA